MEEIGKTETKSGTKTTEFWVTMLGTIVGPGGLVFFLADKLDPNSLVYAIVGAVAAAAAVIWKYIDSRTKVKTQ